MNKLVFLLMVGCHYSPTNGFRYAGYTEAVFTLDDMQRCRIYDEGMSPNDIRKDLEGQGIDCSILDEK